MLKYILMADLRAWVDIFTYVNNIYMRNANPENKDYNLCKKFAELSQKIVITIPIMYFCAGSSYQASKFLDYLFTGILKPPLGIYFPKVYEFGKLGVIAMNLTNIIGVWVCVVSVSIFDTLIYFVFANIVLASSVVQRKLYDFESQLESTRMSSKEIKLELLRIINNDLKYNK